MCQPITRKITDLPQAKNQWVQLQQQAPAVVTKTWQRLAAINNDPNSQTQSMTPYDLKITIDSKERVVIVEYPATDKDNIQQFVKYKFDGTEMTIEQPGKGKLGSC